MVCPPLKSSLLKKSIAELFVHKKILDLPRVFVTVVVNAPLGAVGLVQGVVPLNNITIAMLMLALDVAGVVVLYLVLELVLGVCLYFSHFITMYFKQHWHQFLLTDIYYGKRNVYTSEFTELFIIYHSL
jgi:hypothetical protein